MRLRFMALHLALEDAWTNLLRTETVKLLPLTGDGRKRPHQAKWYPCFIGDVPTHWPVSRIAKLGAGFLGEDHPSRDPRLNRFEGQLKETRILLQKRWVLVQTTTVPPASVERR